MKKTYIFLFIFLSYLNTELLYSKIIYTDPVPNSKFVSLYNSIIIGFDSPIVLSRLNLQDLLLVSGELSGKHTGNFSLSGDKKKLLFKPDVQFSKNELVTITLNAGIHLTDGSVSSAYQFSFTTAPGKNYNSQNTKQKEFYSYDLFNNQYSPLKFDLPELTVTVNNSPENGKLFLSNFPFTPIPNTPFLLIADNDGSIYSGIQLKNISLDFKKQPDGNLTYFDQNSLKYYSLNSGYNITDSFYCGNGYLTDGHELRVLSNSHALVMSYDSQTVDMSQLVVGGQSNCLVIGLVIQEIDENKNVVFQWRSWDHIPITDAQHQNMTTNYIDYIHGNAIELDNDGNILISSRHLDEITKINRSTGNIIWRLGGPRNEFTFINDPERFNYQHGIRRLPNGNIIMFDNGNFHTPPHSRAVEYSLDEVTKTATLVWQYRNTPDNFGFAMGFAQRLDNGNTLISWGSTNPTLTEVTPNGTIALEMSLPQGVYSYRAFKFSWEGDPIFIDPGHIIPSAYRLSQNYPNPFNPGTKIDFDLPEEQYVNLNVFDALGRLVRTIVNSNMKAGPYSMNFDASGLSAGIYFYRVTAGSFSETKKMILIK